MTGHERLPESEANGVVEALRAAVPALADMLDGRRPTTVRRLPDLEVYPSVEFFAVTVTISHRPITHRCARTSGELLRIAGPESIIALNRRVGLRLETPDDVNRYIRAWFQLTGPATEWLATSADQFSWTGAARDDPALAAIAEQAASLVHPANVTRTDSGGFHAVITVMRQQTLQSRILDASPLGDVTEVSSTDLLDRVPVPFVAR